MIPQVLLSLLPSGELALELPGPNGLRRKIELGQRPLETILRVLREQQAKPAQRIGLDGAPTQTQVLHWERHAIWRDPSCSHCASELWASDQRQGRSQRRTQVIKLGDGCEVRRVAPGVRHELGTRATDKSLDELGL